MAGYDAYLKVKKFGKKYIEGNAPLRNALDDLLAHVIRNELPTSFLGILQLEYESERIDNLRYVQNNLEINWELSGLPRSAFVGAEAIANLFEEVFTFDDQDAVIGYGWDERLLWYAKEYANSYRMGSSTAKCFKPSDICSCGVPLDDFYCSRCKKLQELCMNETFDNGYCLECGGTGRRVDGDGLVGLRMSGASMRRMNLISRANQSGDLLRQTADIAAFEARQSQLEKMLEIGDPRAAISSLKKVRNRVAALLSEGRSDEAIRLIDMSIQTGLKNDAEVFNEMRKNAKLLSEMRRSEIQNMESVQQMISVEEHRVQVNEMVNRVRRAIELGSVAVAEISGVSESEIDRIMREVVAKEMRNA